MIGGGCRETDDGSVVVVFSMTEHSPVNHELPRDTELVDEMYISFTLSLFNLLVVLHFGPIHTTGLRHVLPPVNTGNKCPIPYHLPVQYQPTLFIHPLPTHNETLDRRSRD